MVYSLTDYIVEKLEGHSVEVFNIYRKPLGAVKSVLIPEHSISKNKWADKNEMEHVKKSLETFFIQDNEDEKGLEEFLKIVN